MILASTSLSLPELRVAQVGCWLELDVEFVELGAGWKLVGSCGQSLSNSAQVGNWLEVVVGV